MSLTLALPAGRLYQETIEALSRSGLDAEAWRNGNRQLLWASPCGQWRFLLARPADVITYVESGAAGLGVVGKDNLAEAGADVYELLDLGFGGCRIVLAAPTESDGGQLLDGSRPGRGPRVATKYPRLARAFLDRRALEGRVVVLRGAAELAPLVGLADAIIDAVDTGRTLRDNGLTEVCSILTSTARLVCNRATFQLQRSEVLSLVDGLRR